jgi:hypothetical protein
MAERFKVVCIDNSNRPSGIKASNWIDKDETYTVVYACYMSRQNNIIGFKLNEVSLPVGGEYEFFKAARFRPFSELDAEAEEAMFQLLQEVDEMELLEV